MILTAADGYTGLHSGGGEGKNDKINYGLCGLLNTERFSIQKKCLTVHWINGTNVLQHSIESKLQENVQWNLSNSQQFWAGA